MRSRFDEQLEELNQEMIAMGMLCEDAIAKTSQSLMDHDLLLAERIREQLGHIRQKEREIESFCLHLLMQQQPVARDLRTISAALKMVTDMERIGVQSADIAEIILQNNIKRIEKSLHMKELAGAVVKMVHDSMDAFVQRDSGLAQDVIEYDDVVDRYFDEVEHKLAEGLRTRELDEESTMDLLMAAKYYERIGDHAVNIAGWVRFSLTGVHEMVN